MRALPGITLERNDFVPDEGFDLVTQRDHIIGQGKFDHFRNSICLLLNSLAITQSLRDSIDRISNSPRCANLSQSKSERECVLRQVGDARHHLGPKLLEDFHIAIVWDEAIVHPRE